MKPLFPMTVAVAVAVAAAAPIAATAQTHAPGARPEAAETANWMAAGSDIPVDAAWRLGTLPNGLRYAVRRATQPAGTISVRIRVGVGGLMEADEQQGWSHVLEHMAFRGTAKYADGEGLRIWQRLGASFGADTNAATTLTATTFQLDLPRADPTSFREALSVLADMVDTARIDPALLPTERHVVEAELSQRLSPLTRKIKDAQQPLLFAGTRAAARDVIGTRATIANATPAPLKAYYETWYRPDNAVVVVAGDAEPAELEAEVRRAFAGWKASGPTPNSPDWGFPAAPAPAVATVTDPQAPDAIVLAFVAPHADRPMSVSRQQEQYVEELAMGIVNQRLAAAARRGEAIGNATASRSEQRHVQDQVIVQVQPRAGQWQATLSQVYAVLNGATAAEPEQAEIDQQAAVMTANLQQRAASASTATAAALANGLVQDVEAGDITGAPDYYLKLFGTQRTWLTPAIVQAALKRLFASPPRLLVLGPQPIAGGVDGARTALASAQRTTAGTTAHLRQVSLSDLVLAGKPGVAGAAVLIPSLGAQRVRFDEGVELVVKRTEFERDRVHVRVEIGRGLLGQRRDDPGLWWTASALPNAGVGPFSAEELAHVGAGRQVGFMAGAGFRGLTLQGTTNAADLPDLLRLMTGEIASPRFDAVTVDSTRALTLSNYASVFSQPTAVLQLFGGAALHGGDARFQALPARETIERLSLPEFRRFWTARLAEGPVRVTIVGDVDPAAAIAATSRTLAMLPARPDAPARSTDVQANPPASPVVLRHGGDPTQALVVRAFPTLGVLEDPATGDALDLAGLIVQARLTEGFRGAEGGSYTPMATHAQTPDLPRYGVLIAGAQVQVARVDAFGRSLDAVLADLAARPPSADEFVRARATLVSAVQRSHASNEFWITALSSDLSPARVARISGRAERLLTQTPTSVQAAAARYLSTGRGFTVEVLPRSAGELAPKE